MSNHSQEQSSTRPPVLPSIHSPIHPSSVHSVNVPLTGGCRARTSTDIGLLPTALLPEGQRHRTENPNGAAVSPATSGPQSFIYCQIFTKRSRHELEEFNP